MPYTKTTGFSLNPFHQECLDYHNFFRALHNLKPLQWDMKLQMSSQQWAVELKKRAPNTPNKARQKTKHWPHSDSPSTFRPKNVGENIAWDLTENGHPCRESVYRWYAELFYFNPKNGQKGRRGNDPVGHLTQLLWPETTKVGCGSALTAVKQPPNTIPSVLLSTYTVCHYSPQGNIIGQIEKKYSPLSKKYCSTYNNQNGKNKCENAGFSNCMGLSHESTCDQCVQKPIKVNNKAVPKCTGPCLIYCANQWGTRNYWPHECIGASSCTCGKEGAVCT